MKSPKVPKSFTLGAIPYTVSFKKILLDDQEMAGAVDYNTQKVFVNKMGSANESIEQTFYHEALHCIMHALGRYDLREDEEFIEQTSQLLYQLIKTSKY